MRTIEMYDMPPKNNILRINNEIANNFVLPNSVPDSDHTDSYEKIFKDNEIILNKDINIHDVVEDTVQHEGYTEDIVVTDIEKYRREVIDLVNTERKKEGLSMLSEDSLLNQISQKHSEDMIKRGFFAHINPDGQSPFDRMTENNLKYMTAGENIAYGQETPMQVMDSWMNSEGHRANILNKEFDSIGVGIATDIYGTVYWTQSFIGN